MLISRFPKTLPLMELVALWDDMGVSGGVLKGWLEFVAVTEGTVPRIGVGLFTTLAALEVAEEGVAGPELAARAGTAVGVGAGVPIAANEALPAEFLRGEVKIGDCTVGAFEDTPTLDEIGCGFSIVYTWPSSPGEKESDEQNPSEELIIRVSPSCDLIF